MAFGYLCFWFSTFYQAALGVGAKAVALSKGRPVYVRGCSQLHPCSDRENPGTSVWASPFLGSWAQLTCWLVSTRPGCERPRAGEQDRSHHLSSTWPRISFHSHGKLVWEVHLTGRQGGLIQGCEYHEKERITFCVGCRQHLPIFLLVEVFFL